MQGCRLELRPKRVEERSTCLNCEDVIFEDIVVAMVARYIFCSPALPLLHAAVLVNIGLGLPPELWRKIGVENSFQAKPRNISRQFKHRKGQVVVTLPMTKNDEETKGAIPTATCNKLV